MSLGMDLLIATRSLFQHRRRTLLLGGAIAGVTALMVLLGGLSTGIRSTMVRTATTLMTGHINIAGFYKVTTGNGAPVVTDYEKVLAIAKPVVPELDYVVQRGRGWAKIVSDSGSTQVGMGGIDIANERGFKEVIRIAEGNLDDLARPGSILLFEEQAKKLEVKVGDSLTISAPTPRGINNTIDVRVVAIAREVGMMSKFNVFVPDQTLRDLYQLAPGTTGALHLLLKDMKDIPAVQARLRETFAAAGFRIMDADPQPFWMKFEKVSREDWTGQKLDITTWEDETSWMKWILQTLDILTLILISTLLVIVVIGIMNTMWIAIRERTAEIGTLRAIGMQRGRVLRMFVIESLLLGILGTVAGATLGALFAAVVNGLGIQVPISVQLFLMSDTLVLAIQPDALLRAVLIITVVTTLSALYPSMRAARLKPVTAMHHIG